MKGKWKRLLAAMLAASMIFGNAVPAYATESQPVVEIVEAETEVADENAVLDETDVVDDTNTSEEPVLENVEETTEEATEEKNNEEGEEILIEEVVETETVLEYQSGGKLCEKSGNGWNAYNRTEEGSHYLIVELSELGSADMEELVSAIMECRAAVSAEVEANGVGYDYCRIEIQYDDLSSGNYVPATLWNVLVRYASAAAAEETVSRWKTFSAHSADRRQRAPMQTTAETPKPMRQGRARSVRSALGRQAKSQASSWTSCGRAFFPSQARGSLQIVRHSSGAKSRARGQEKGSPRR